MGRLDQLGDAVRSLVKQGDAPQVIRAYHGSPYDFDRFDASKIGTGEGNQAYGHGLYFAGNENTARTYRDDLSRGSVIVEGAKTPWTESTMDDMGVRPSARVTIRMAMRDQADPIDRLLQAQSGHGPLSKYWNEYQDAIEILRGATGKLIPNPGKMYEVEIGHPEKSLLDFDARVYRQEPAVRDAVRALLGRDADNLRGRVAHDNIAKFYSDGLSDDGAAKALVEQGVPGVRYFDGMSRGAQKGTRNYVMFPGTEDSIRILRKFAVPGLIGAGAASLDSHPE